MCRLNAEEFTNAGAVLVRVFLELSCDHYLTKHCNGDTERTLAKKMKESADHLKKMGAIDKAVCEMVYKNADSKRYFAASLVTFHQYVHNRKTNPKKADLIEGWDELQPFFAALWP